MYEIEKQASNTTPGIYYIRDVFKDEFDTELINKELKEKVTDFEPYKNDFIQLLTTCLEDIFDTEIPFIQTENVKICQYCPYIGVCNR